MQCNGEMIRKAFFVGGKFHRFFVGCCLLSKCKKLEGITIAQRLARSVDAFLCCLLHAVERRVRCLLCDDGVLRFPRTLCAVSGEMAKEHVLCGAFLKSETAKRSKGKAGKRKLSRCQHAIRAIQMGIGKREECMGFSRRAVLYVVYAKLFQLQ